VLILNAAIRCFSLTCLIQLCFFFSRKECSGNRISHFPHDTWLENKTIPATPDYMGNTGCSVCYRMILSEACWGKNPQLCWCEVAFSKITVGFFPVWRYSSEDRLCFLQSGLRSSHPMSVQVIWSQDMLDVWIGNVHILCVDRWPVSPWYDYFPLS